MLLLSDLRNETDGVEYKFVIEFYWAIVEFSYENADWVDHNAKYKSATLRAQLSPGIIVSCDI